MAVCGATPIDHCCWVDGEVCQHFDPAGVVLGSGCRLRREHPSWEAVYLDPRYPFDPARIRCGDWPPPGGCATCGVSDG